MSWAHLFLVGICGLVAGFLIAAQCALLLDKTYERDGIFRVEDRAYKLTRIVP